MKVFKYFSVYINETVRKDLSSDMLPGLVKHNTFLLGALSQDDDDTVRNQEVFGDSFLISVSAELSDAYEVL